MNIFEFNTYREILKDFIKHNRTSRGYHKNLSKAAGCKTSYLSQVINSNVQLTPDHAYGLAAYWNLDEDETEYFLALVNVERSNSINYKKFIEKKIRKYKEKKSKLKRVIPDTTQNDDNLLISYYSSWLYPALHVAVSIPDFQTEDSISHALHIPLETVQKVLNELEKLNFVERNQGHWQMTKKSLHVPEDSILSQMGHMTMRHKTIQTIQEKNTNGIHYSGFHSLSQKDFEKIQNLIVETIGDVRKIIDPSLEENLVCFSCDFYSILKKD